MIGTQKLNLRRLAMSGLGRRADMIFTDSLIWFMRRFDPGLTMGRFYAKLGMWIVRAGFAHYTLGPRIVVKNGARVDDLIVVSATNSASGRFRFDDLLALGLKPEDIVVDYGCGTLRVGRYLIDYLTPGAYWGLDINDDILRLGRTMLGADRLREKQPNIMRITDQSLAACAAAEPQFVMSIAVLMHVPPCDLEDYCRSITTVGGTDTTYYVSFSAASKTTRTAGTTWSYGREHVVEVFQRHLPEHEITTRLVLARGRFNGRTIHSAVLVAAPPRAGRMAPITGGCESEVDGIEPAGAAAVTSPEWTVDPVDRAACPVNDSAIAGSGSIAAAATPFLAIRERP